jgi:two-component system, chemotaxis family, chemotaxis protein CheY
MPSESNRPTVCILVVDDSDDLRGLVCTTLKQKGFSVLDAVCAEAALIAAAGNSIDGVLTDYEMPGMSGIELCQKLASLDRILGRTVPVWIMTGVPGAEIESRARAAGAKGFIRKPFSTAQVAQIFEAELMTHQRA